jgi:5'-deoxynucleotidase YfbR-like HD superfamily hydrolase
MPKSICKYCVNGKCSLTGISLDLKRIKRICSKPLSLNEKEPVYACRFIFLLDKEPRRIDEESPNLLQMKLEDFLNVFRSMYPDCPKCSESRNKICFKHEFLENKLAYIAQEFYGFRFNTKFKIKKYGPVAEVIRWINMGGKTLDNVLEGKNLRAKLTNKEQRFLQTLIEFFSKWDLQELQLLTTEHMFEKTPSPQTGTISTETLVPFLDLINKVRGLQRLSRWQLKTTMIPQNLAEHTCNVMLISMIISDFLRSLGLLVNVEKVLRKAALHDLDEVAVGFDVPTPIKYDKESTREFINKLGFKYYSEMIKELPENVRVEYIKAKQEGESLEDGVVQVADKLDALIYALEQVKFGNYYFNDVVEDKVRFLKQIKPEILRHLTLSIIEYYKRAYGIP